MGAGNCYVRKMRKGMRLTARGAKPTRTWCYVCPTCGDREFVSLGKNNRKNATKMFWTHIKTHHGGSIRYVSIFDLPCSGEVSTSL